MKSNSSTPSFFAIGELTGLAIWTTSDLPTLIASLVTSLTGQEGYLNADPAGRQRAREKFCLEIATRTQVGLIQAAISAGTWSWEGASLREIERLTRPKQVADHDTGAWKGGVPLILVRPEKRYWRVPAGRVRAISPATDSAVLFGALALGWLTGAGRLDSTGGISERGRR
jgi:hypothetical protein